jgi:peptidoglycan/LPS O-acetylase OafA/YrhL
LVVATACLSFAAVFLRFGGARSAFTDSLSENAYSIYLVHYVFVVWLQYALLEATLPALVKAVLVFVGALLLSWGVALGAGRFAALARQFRNAASNAGWRSASSRKVRSSG